MKAEWIYARTSAAYEILKEDLQGRREMETDGNSCMEKRRVMEMVNTWLWCPLSSFFTKEFLPLGKEVWVFWLWVKKHFH
jgi:hypothetical protein